MGESAEADKESNGHSVSSDKLEEADKLKALANAAFKGTTSSLEASCLPVAGNYPDNCVPL